MRPLRILAMVVPMAVAELRGASDYNALQDLVRNSLAAGYNWYWYIVIPSRYRDDVRPDDFPDNCMVAFIDNECKDYYTEIAHSNSQIVGMFNQQWGEYPIDAVWTERTVSGAVWQRMLSRQAAKLPIPTTICEPEVEDARLINQETDAMLRAISAVSCKYVVLNPDQIRLAVARYGKYLSGTMMRKFHESCRAIPLGADFKILDKVIDRTSKSEDFTVLYGGRVAAIKRVDQAVKVMDGAHATGLPIRNLITTQTVGGKYLGDIQDMAETVEFRIGMGREEFYEIAAASQVFLSASGEDSEGTGLWEGLYLAGVGAFSDRPWVRGLMPPEWPYLWRSVEEGIALLRLIHSDYAKARQWTDRIRQHLRETMNSAIQAGKHMEVIAEGVELWKGPTSTLISRCRWASTRAIISRTEVPTPVPTLIVLCLRTRILSIAVTCASTTVLRET